MIEILLFKCQVFSPCQIWPLHLQWILNNIHPQWMVTIRNVLNCVQPPRHTTPFFTQHGGMEDERRWDAENCRMRCGKLSYGECITELAKIHFHQWRKYFQRCQSSLGVCFSLQSVVIFKRNLLEIVLSAFDKKLWTKKSVYLVMNMANAQELSGRVWT